MRKINKSSGLIEDIKRDIKKAGANKAKFVYFKSGSKVRVRFLSDLEDGFKIPFHDSYAKGINVPCQEIFGRDCLFCGDDDLRHQDLYAWSVFDYEAKQVKILMGRVNSFSPIPSLVGMYEAYGTLKDRDYIITKQGEQTNTTFSVAPMDKVKFKNKKAAAISEKQFLKYLDKAYPADTEEDDEEEKDYEDMTAVELYKVCKENGIKCKPKKKKSYYLELLEDLDEEDEEDEEELEDDEEEEEEEEEEDEEDEW